MDCSLLRISSIRAVSAGRLTVMRLGESVCSAFFVSCSGVDVVSLLIAFRLQKTLNVALLSFERISADRCLWSIGGRPKHMSYQWVFRQTSVPSGGCAGRKVFWLLLLVSLEVWYEPLTSQMLTRYTRYVHHKQCVFCDFNDVFMILNLLHFVCHWVLKLTVQT